MPTSLSAVVTQRTLRTCSIPIHLALQAIMPLPQRTIISLVLLMELVTHFQLLHQQALFKLPTQTITHSVRIGKQHFQAAYLIQLITTTIMEETGTEMEMGDSMFLVQTIIIA